MQRVVCLTVVVSLVLSVMSIACGIALAQGGTGALPENQMVTVGDIDVAYRVYGEGEPLVLSSGYGETMDDWDPSVVETLAGKYKVIEFDNRGIGGTTEGTEPFSVVQFSEDAAGFIEALNIGPVHVLGYSMGSMTAIELVLNHPTLVKKLVLYGTSPGGPNAIPMSASTVKDLTDTSGTPQERGERLLRLMFPAEWFDAHMQEIFALFTRPHEEVSLDVVNRQTEALGSWAGRWDDLPAIQSDTLVIVGREDIIAPAENSVKVAGRIPGAWLVQLKGAGHGAMYQYPDTFAQLVLDFLAAP